MPSFSVVYQHWLVCIGFYSPYVRYYLIVTQGVLVVFYLLKNLIALDVQGSLLYISHSQPTQFFFILLIVLKVVVFFDPKISFCCCNYSFFFFITLFTVLKLSTVNFFFRRSLEGSAELTGFLLP